MYKYLTQKYKCRDTNESDMTPLEYCTVLGADSSARAVANAIAELEKSIKALEAAEVRGGEAKRSKTFLQNLMKKDDYEARGTEAPEEIMSEQHDHRVKREEVTTDRVIAAKTRLQAFQEERSTSNKTKGGKKK